MLAQQLFLMTRFKVSDLHDNGISACSDNITIGYSHLIRASQEKLKMDASKAVDCMD